MKGRATICPCCDRRLIVRPGERWESRDHRGIFVDVIEPYKDGAIVEQVDRQERFGLGYRDMLAHYQRVTAPTRNEGPQ